MRIAHLQFQFENANRQAGRTTVKGAANHAEADQSSSHVGQTRRESEKRAHCASASQKWGKPKKKKEAQVKASKVVQEKKPVTSRIRQPRRKYFNLLLCNQSFLRGNTTNRRAARLKKKNSAT